jgi:heterogeneous nuclear ribonucleoprotein Nrd1-like protein
VISIIPIYRLTEAERKGMLTAEYGGTGGQSIKPGMVVEEPDIIETRAARVSLKSWFILLPSFSPLTSYEKHLSMSPPSHFSSALTLANSN